MINSPPRERKNIKNKVIFSIVLIFILSAIFIFFFKNKTQKISMPITPGEEKYKPISVSALDLSEIYKNTKGDENIKLSTLGDFLDIGKRIDSKESFHNKKILLMNDIFLTENGESSGKMLTFKAIGNDDSPFDGIFDGSGKSLVCNLNFEQDESGLTNGIFANISQNASFFDLNVKGKIEGDYDSFILENRGNLKNLNVDMIIKDNSTSVSGICSLNIGNIQDCKISGEFSTNNMNLSGICSINEGIISKCVVQNLKLFNHTEQTVSDPSENEDNESFQLPETASIASFNIGKIESCSSSNIFIENKGKSGTAGGVCSTNNGLITDCDFSGEILANLAGGLTGSNYAVINKCSVKNTIITANEGSEFTHKNQFGANEYEWKELQKQPLGIIEDCSFDLGKVEAAKYKIGACLNLSDNTNYTPEESSTITFPRDPLIKNCIVDSKLITRNKD